MASETESKGTSVDEVVACDSLAGVIGELMQDAEVVDVHTHLFPPSHGDLMLTGVDQLLTYHYLIAELFRVVDPSALTPEQFFALPQRGQADVVWQELFVKRPPLSEACRGVISTLSLLGFRSSVLKPRDLSVAREYFETAGTRQRCCPAMFRSPHNPGRRQRGIAGGGLSQGESKVCSDDQQPFR